MDQKQIGAFLRTLRKGKGLTQEQLAEKLGVTGRSVSRWETGSNLPDLSILIELADFYDTDIREILRGERQREDMDKDTKETLVEVAEYADTDRQQKLRLSLIFIAAAFVLFTVIYAYCAFILCHDADSEAVHSVAFFAGKLALLGMTAAGTGICVLLRRTKKAVKPAFRMLGWVLTPVLIVAGILSMTLLTMFMTIPDFRRGQTASAEISLGASQHYTREDLDTCVKLVRESFRADFHGCRLVSLTYDEEISDAYDSPYSGETLVLLSVWETVDGNEDPTGITRAENWQWVLTRAEGGEWVLRDSGYA